MKLITDNASDLTAEQQAGLDFIAVPLQLELGAQTWTDDIDPDSFYDLLDKSDELPKTSQPSPAAFVEAYKNAGDTELLSAHISSGLSGTANAARIAAGQVKADGIDVTIVDTLTLSCAEGWQVEAAGRGINAGWPREKIIATLDTIRTVSDAMFTLPDLQYLIHGGRISHMQGLIASTLGIKPLIGVSKEDGTYTQRGRVRTFKRAIKQIPQTVAKDIPEGSKLRVQPLHARNVEGVEMLKKAFSELFECEFLPTGRISPALGAHTGPGLVGAVFAKADDYPDVPTASS